MSRSRREDPRKPLWYDQDNFRQFKQEYDAERAKPLLFIGSGLSISAGFPNWDELLRLLKVEATADMVKIGSEFDEKVKRKQYDEAGSILKRAFKQRHTHENEWRRLLDKILNDPSRLERIPDVLMTLCGLRWDRIVTTNYDRLIELAYEQSHGGEELQVYHPWSEHPDAAVSDHRRYVFKIHGDIGDEHSKIVLTTEEYEELYKGKKNERFREALVQILGNASVILFLGFSYEDQYFKRLFNSLYRRTEAPKRSFGLFPEPGPSVYAREARKVQALVKQTGIRPISYRNPDDAHEEFVEFLEYLRAPESYDKRYNAPTLKKKATVILLHSGGTIGAIRSEHDRGDELDLHKIGSRFHPRLQTISDIIQERFRQFYNTASEFQFELKWEILPPAQQILSENATVDHWNNLVNKLEETVYKYQDGPELITKPQNGIPEKEPKSRPGGPTLRGIYERERKEYKFVHRKGELTETEFLEDIEDRYIAGIVVLHGTDTLASAAAALAVGMNNLPFPIVVTGANRPPDEESLGEKVAVLSKSDTWKNLVTSLYFLQCFGHRFTETFVCFGDTIHHGMNLRKTSIESAPLKRVGASHQDIEPFIFRNASINKQYLFRLIDGVFCNNCYPIGRFPYTELIKPAYDYLRHVRPNPFGEKSGKRLKTFRFSPTVSCVAVSPSFPHIDVSHMLEAQPSIRAVLVEGYKSGTYPTIESNLFTQFISELYRQGIPVILVSHYGIKPTQERYETLSIDGKSIRVLRLYGMIPETALPLLCRVVSSINQEEWDGRLAIRRPRVSDRVKLIARELKKLFKTTDNIISLEFGDITDPKAIGERSIENSIAGSELENNKHGLDQTITQSLSVDPATLPTLPAISDDPDDSLVIIPRSDFLWTFSEVIKPVERVGSAPDGFAILADMGFEWGFKEFHQLCLNRVAMRHNKPFFECGTRERRTLKSNASKMLNLTAIALERRGLAYFDWENEPVIRLSESSGDDSVHSPSFSLRIVLKRKNQTVRGDEKYNVQSYSPLESQFFKDLNEGPGREDEDPAESPLSSLSNVQHVNALAIAYDALMESSWQQQTLSFDWYILGVFKGITCAMAWYFLFDDWSRWHDRNRNAGYDKAMRQSVKCDIVQGGEAYFEFEMTYYGWYEHN
jgi:L-asparaginase/Glu-tRNA(Gln) amidotransferase subunit D